MRTLDLHSGLSIASTNCDRIDELASELCPLAQASRLLGHSVHLLPMKMPRSIHFNPGSEHRHTRHDELSKQGQGSCVFCICDCVFFNGVGSIL